MERGDAPVALTIELLERLAVRWRERSAPIVEHLQPGISGAQMDALTDPIGLRLPAEARTWWGWHNGANPGLGSRAVERNLGIGMMEFMPLEEAVREYQTGRELMLEAGGEVEDWPPSWFPISSQGHGDVVVLNSAVPSSAVSPIHLVEWEQPSPEPVAASFGDMVSLWIEAIDVGRWVYDPGNRHWHVADVEVAGQRFHPLI